MTEPTAVIVQLQSARRDSFVFRLAHCTKLGPQSEVTMSRGKKMREVSQNRNWTGQALGSRSKHATGPSQMPNGPVLDSSAKGCKEMRTSVTMFLTSPAVPCPTESNPLQIATDSAGRTETNPFLHTRIQHQLSTVTLAVPRKATTIETSLANFDEDEVPLL